MEKNIVYWWRKMLNAHKKSARMSSALSETYKISDTNLSNSKRYDYIEWMNQTAKEIIEAVDKLVSSSRFKPDDKELHIYIHNTLLYQVCANCGLEELISSGMYMEKNYTFRQYIIHDGGCDEPFSLSSINEYVSINIRSRKPESLLGKAFVTSLTGNGSIIGKKVELTAEANRDPEMNRYNIGAGRMPKLDNGSVRFNHIAIDDDATQLSFEQNKYVSRSHAYIQYGDKGFTLYAENGGTRLRGKRTTVFRNGQLIKLELPGMGVPLKHGDQIILSKSVILLFEQTK